MTGCQDECLRISYDFEETPTCELCPFSEVYKYYRDCLFLIENVKLSTVGNIFRLCR